MGFTQFVAWKDCDTIFVERLGRPDEWVEVTPRPDGGATVKIKIPEVVQLRGEAHKPMCLFRKYDDGELELAVGDPADWDEIAIYVKGAWEK